MEIPLLSFAMSKSDLVPEIVFSDQAHCRQTTDLFNDEYHLFSAFNFYKPSQLKVLAKSGIHAYSKVTGPILMDSGGFQLYRKNLQLDYQDTLKIYEAAKLGTADYGISLDFVPLPDDSDTVKWDKLAKTHRIYSSMAAQNEKIVPVVHGWTEKEIRSSLTQLEDPNYHGFFSYGSCFPMIMRYTREIGRAHV